MYVCMYACMHACMHGWMDVCMYVYVYIYIYAYIFNSVSEAGSDDLQWPKGQNGEPPGRQAEVWGFRALGVPRDLGLRVYLRFRV